MRVLLERPGVVLVDEKSWPVELDSSAFSDADQSSDLDRLGLAWQAAPARVPRVELPRP